MKRFRKIALVLAVAAVAAVSLPAATWVWSSPYDNVTGYRYQIGSESEDGWIYVDRDVTSLTLDSKEDTTIYVQLTVDDGRSWSPSGVATYVPQAVLPVENLNNVEQVSTDLESGIVEDAAPVDEVVIETAPEVEPVAEAEPEEDVTVDEPAEEVAVEVIAEAEPEKDEFVEAVPVRKGREFSFGMGVGVASEFMARTYSIQPILSFDFHNVASPADWFGLDIDWNLIGLFSPDANLNGGLIKFFENVLGSKFAMGGATELVLRPAFMFGGMELGIGLGGGVSVYAASTLPDSVNFDKTPVLYENDSIKLNAYALASADVTYNFNDTFGMGVGYKFKYIFDKDMNARSQMSHSAVVTMGLSF